MSKNIGNIKIKLAAKHLAAQQKADKQAEKASQKAAHQAQTTPLAIAGGYRNPNHRQTAFQKDLQASPDYIVPKQSRSPKPARSTTK
jgi:hypothetical protein